MQVHLRKDPGNGRAVRFSDRVDAGRRLARALASLRGTSPLVLALPRGGVPVAGEVAEALDAPLDVLVARKLGAPWQPELAMGAIAPDGVRVLNDGLVAALRVSPAEIDAVAAREAKELDRRVHRYREGRPPLDVRDRTVVLVDDGIATGATVRAALRWLAAHEPRRVILAAPVAAADTVEELRAQVDEVVALSVPDDLQAIGVWYDRFDQVSDEEVLAILEAAWTREGRAGRASAAARSAAAHEDLPGSSASSLDVKIPAGTRTLDGTLVVPANAGGVVVFAHGSGSGRFSPRNRYVARVLNDAGLGTLLMDLLTEEEERADDRTGRLRFDLRLLADRLGCAIDWLARHRSTGGLPIGLFGASTGGGAALIAAAEFPREVVAVVSRGGRPDLAGDVILGLVKAPTLLIVGGEDRAVIEMNQRAFQAMVCRKRLEIVPGATHLFEEPGALEQVGALAADWFLARMPPRGAAPAR